MNYKSILYKSLACLCTLGSADYLMAEEAPESITLPNNSDKQSSSIDRKSSSNHFQTEKRAWHLTGNHNVDSKNFLGTFDKTAVNISANGIPKGVPYIRVTALGQIEVLNTHQGVFIGQGAGASNDKCENNTFVGFRSGQNTILEPLFEQPGDNTAVGHSSLFANTIGQDNTAIGSSALRNTVQASQNTAVGFQALFSSVDGSFNTALGSSALQAGLTGSFNTAVGFSALHNNAQNFNTAVGHQCMGGNSTGASNTAIGTNALINNTTGNSNTAVGVGALTSNQTGSTNTALGAAADVAVFGGPFTNATAIGYAAVCDASNKVRIGNPFVEVIEGQVDFTTPSDGRFKINVKSDVPGLSFIMNLRPVTYQIDIDRMSKLMKVTDKVRSKMKESRQNNSIKSGFIAQEVETAAQECGYDFSGLNVPENEEEGYYGLAYSSFVVSLVKSVQEQQAFILEMQQNIKQLNDALHQQQQIIERLESMKSAPGQDLGNNLTK